MNNKGFTLIELVAVIVILLGIAGISVVSITSSLKRNDDKELKRQEEIIINAAKVYFSLEEEDSTYVCNLIEEGYFKEDDVSKYVSNCPNNCVIVRKNNGYLIDNVC